MQSIAFFNNKGGVGKTTLLCNVAAYFAQHLGQSVCVIDADPQCNATQYFFDEDYVLRLFEQDGSFTISSVLDPLSSGEGYSENIQVHKAERFGVDVIVGDPRLALTEDLLAKDWGDAKAGELRGIRTSLVFSELLSRLQGYDYVFFDVSPSLGAINRSILLSADYFVSPMSIDIFSLRAFENISKWIDDWWTDWTRGIDNVRQKDKIPNLNYGQARFLGYVTQQYLAKKDATGQRRAVQAYENIRLKIDSVIDEYKMGAALQGLSYEIGTVPNLFSLIPMSQSNHTPVFGLLASDGVVGAHFSKVREAKEIFGEVATGILQRATK